MRTKICGIIIFLLINASLFPATIASTIQTNEHNIEDIANGQILKKCQSDENRYVKDTYMIPMRDGIHLATDVYLPYEGCPPHGSILVRTPYNKNFVNLGSWADAGWPSVVQDMRGRFASEGIDTVFRHSYVDGPDTLAWMADQSWSNGKIATFGGSALGITQYFMAGANPPNLSCQFIQVATPDLHKHAVYQGGQFRKYMIEGWLEGQGSTYILPELWENENYTLQYWTNVSLEDNWKDVHVPAVHVGGWYDCFAQGTIDGFMGYNYLGGNGALGKSKLVIGPWTHGGSQTTHQGQLVYPANSIDTFSFNMFVDMIEQYTMNGPDDFDQWPNATYYTMGDVDNNSAPGNEWRYADDWPPASTEIEWHFHENNVLSTAYPDDYNPLTYTYDPENPVPTAGGQNLILPAGPYDQTSVENRDDVLVFTSSILTEPYEATGPIKARLYVSSDCPDTDFTVKLTDVYPDGRSMLITDGILRMRNRNGRDHWEFMNSGEIYEVEIDMWSTSYIWNTGHRIRVAVSSSNYPRFLANPNTEDGIYQNTNYNITLNTLYLDSEHPSCLILPVIQDNFQPKTPNIDGATSGSAGTPYTYTFTSTDPDGDQVSYYIKWDDGSITDWTAYQASGTTFSESHTWFEQGTFTIKAKAKDIFGAESDWAELSVSMPRNRAVNTPFLQLLEQYPILYQLLLRFLRL